MVKDTPVTFKVPTPAITPPVSLVNVALLEVSVTVALGAVTVNSPEFV